MFPVFAKMVFKKFSVPGNAMLDSNLSAIQFQLFWKHYLPLLIFTRFVNTVSLIITKQQQQQQRSSICHIESD